MSAMLNTHQDRQKHPVPNGRGKIEYLMISKSIAGAIGGAEVVVCKADVIKKHTIYAEIKKRKGHTVAIG